MVLGIPVQKVVIDEGIMGASRNAKRSMLMSYKKTITRAVAMRVAGGGVDVLELAERGAPAGVGAERRHDLGQRGDGLVAEQGDDRVGGELGWPHYGTIADLHSRNAAITRTRRTSQNSESLRTGGTGRRSRELPGPCALLRDYRHF